MIGELSKYQKGQYVYEINNNIYNIENNGYYPPWNRDMWVISQLMANFDKTTSTIYQTKTYPDFTNISDTLKGCIKIIDEIELIEMETLS